MRSDKGNEANDQNQRAGGGLGRCQAADHVGRLQPAVGTDGLLGDIGDCRIRSAEGDKRGAGENRPWSTRMLSRPVSNPTATMRPLQMANATRRMISIRRDVGRSWCSWSSVINGGWASSAEVGVGCAIHDGSIRPNTQPSSPTPSTTAGNGTAKTVSFAPNAARPAESGSAC